jgi:hypothetical protein
MWMALVQPMAGPVSAAEICRYAGTTDYAGHVVVVTTATSIGDTRRVDVAIRFEAVAAFWLHVKYLIEEISAWRKGDLLRLDLNNRYLLAGRVVRQQWDEFHDVGGSLQAYRLQGKTSAQFSRRYPQFARHWDLAAFGQPWLDDYASATPDRRPDLDLERLPQAAAVQSPFALAFYWVRFLRPARQRLPVFLPGFKRAKLADVAMVPGAAAPGTLWRAELHHPYLSDVPPSDATAQISQDRHLERLTFDLHTPAGSASGNLYQGGCTGSLP